MRESHAVFLALMIAGLALSGVSYTHAQGSSGDKDFEALCKDKTVHVPKGGSAPQDKIEGGKKYVNGAEGQKAIKIMIWSRQAKTPEEAKKMLVEKYGWCHPEEKKNCGKASYIDEGGAKKSVCDDRCDPGCDAKKPPTPPGSEGGAPKDQPKAGEPKSMAERFAEQGKKMLDSLLGKEDPMADRPLSNDTSGLKEAFDAEKATPPVGPPSGQQPQGDTVGDALRKMIDDQAQWEAEHPANQQTPMGKAELGEDLVFRDSTTGKEIPPEVYEAYEIKSQPDVAAIQNPRSDYETNPAWDPGGLSENTFGEPESGREGEPAPEEPAVFGRNGCLSSGDCPQTMQPSYGSRADEFNQDVVRPVVGGASRYDQNGRPTSSGDTMNRNDPSMACMMCANGEIWKLDTLGPNGEILKTTYAYVNDTGAFSKYNGGQYVDSEGQGHDLGRAFDVSPHTAANLGFNDGFRTVQGTPIAITRSTSLARSIVGYMNRGYSFPWAYTESGGLRRGRIDGITRYAF